MCIARARSRCSAALPAARQTLASVTATLGRGDSSLSKSAQNGGETVRVEFVREFCNAEHLPGGCSQKLSESQRNPTLPRDRKICKMAARRGEASMLLEVMAEC